MRVNVFWSKTTFNSLVEEQICEILNYYLIKINLLHSNFNICFESLTMNVSDIAFLPENIISADNVIINPKQFTDLDAIFILAELDWHNHKLTDLYGVRVAQKFRLANVKCPIFICSFLPESYLIKNRQYKILTFRGHYFIHLPEGIRNDYEITPLDEIELLDCKMHYCGIEGAIRDIYHNKQHIIYEENFDKAKSQIFELLNEIINLNDLPEYLKPEIEKLKKQVQDKTTITELRIFCKEDDSKILAHLKPQDKDAKEDYLYDEIKGDWKILFLEDVSEDIDSLKSSFINAGIKNENMLIATTYNEAVEIISNDTGNKIGVVICDFGLIEDGNSKGKQGYSFVEWLSKQDRYNEIYVYSGRARKFLKEIFRELNIRVSIHSKYDVINRMSDFVDDVLEKGNEIAELIISQPTATSWRKLQVYYRNYRSWSGYNYMEREINEISHNVIKQFKYLRQTTENLNLSDKDFAVSKIPTFPNISGDLYKEFSKEQVDENHDLLVGFENKNIKLYTKELRDKKKNIENEGGEPQFANNDSIDSYYCFYSITNDKYRDKYFKNKLITRRLAWWFLFIEGLHPNTVYSLLRNGVFQNYYFVKYPEKYNEWTESDDRGIPETPDFKSAVNTDLAIAKEDFPFNLLIEEKNWFKYEMGVDLNDVVSVICGFEYYFHELFEEYKSKMNQERIEFIELEKNFVLNDKFLFYSANDIRKALELSIKSLDNANDKKELLFKALNRYDLNDIICMPYFERLRNYMLNQLKLLKNR